jgi:putative tryptophan/tyrosine transport system substrate-binding protein
MLALKILSIRDKGADLDGSFSSLRGQGAGALIVVPDPMLIDIRDRVVALSAHYRLPTVYPVREFAEAGGLMSYGTDFRGAIHQSGLYAGKILSGAKPADLPVIQSVKLELVINLKSAKALNLTIPPTVLARADEVIE